MGVRRTGFANEKMVATRLGEADRLNSKLVNTAAVNRLTIDTLSAAAPNVLSEILGFLILVFGLGLLLGLFWHLSAKSKWNEYALRYPCPNQPAGRTWPVRWASFGKRGNQCKSTYEKFVQVHFTEQGASLSMGRIMGYFYKPFLMPWRKVKFVNHYDGPFYRKYMISIWEGADEIYLAMLDNGQGDLLKQFYKKTIAQVTREWSWMHNSDLIERCRGAETFLTTDGNRR